MLMSASRSIAAGLPSRATSVVLLPGLRSRRVSNKRTLVKAAIT